MDGPHVLVVLDAAGAWSRGILKGFIEVANEHGWTLLHYYPSADLDWLVREWSPEVAVLGPHVPGYTRAKMGRCAVVSVNADRTAEGTASICLDEEKIADLALAHFLANRLPHLTTFRFDTWPFAVARDRRFLAGAAKGPAKLVPGWWVDGGTPPRNVENPRALVAWLQGLPKPCGVFACTDPWARIVARYARAAGMRVPEDVAIVGVDNDTVDCELTVPPLSSVAVPWRTIGESAASLVQQALAGKSIEGTRVVISPLDVVARRSSDVLAIDDATVVAAVRFIREHSATRISVPSIARAAGTSRQRLERRFKAVLGRTVLHEIRRARVEVAKGLIATTQLGLLQVAKRSGFSSAALLSVAFGREVGMPPGAYRRGFRKAVDTD